MLCLSELCEKLFWAASPRYVLALLLTCAGAGWAQSNTQARLLSVYPSNRLTAPIDDSRTVALDGSVYRLAKPQNDAGPLEPGHPMPGMTLALRRDGNQQAALDELTYALADPASPMYHQWLKPEVFGEHFGISGADMAKVTGWLQAHGFSIDDVPG